MPTILKACSEPWEFSGEVTLHHTETDVGPGCRVMCAVRSYPSGVSAKSGLIELYFETALYARVGPHHDGNSVEEIGYKIDHGFDGSSNKLLPWLYHEWEQNGVHPYSGFYHATESEWLSSLKLKGSWTHFVIDGRNGYVELIAKSYDLNHISFEEFENRMVDPDL